MVAAERANGSRILARGRAPPTRSAPSVTSADRRGQPPRKHKITPIRPFSSMAGRPPMLGVDRDSKGEQHVLELQVLAGDPSAEEIAAVTAVLLMTLRCRCGGRGSGAGVAVAGERGPRPGRSARPGCVAGVGPAGPPVTRFVLASASPARRALLPAAGFEPEVIVSDVDESTVDSADAAELSGTLARLKAEAVAAPAQPADRRWCWAATRCSRSTARSSASRPTPPTPSTAGGGCAAGTACCTPATA